MPQNFPCGSMTLTINISEFDYLRNNTKLKEFDVR